MKQIDLDKHYFHGIRPPGEDRDERDESVLLILDSILKHNAILRAQQTQLGIKPILNDNLNSNRNENISICENHSIAYLNWVKNQVSIVLPKDMPECEINTHCRGLDGEIHVKDQIPAEYFLGIGIPTGTSTILEVIEDIKFITTKSIIPGKYNKSLTDRLKNFYQDLGIFDIQTYLDENGYTLPLFDIQNRVEIPNIKSIINGSYKNCFSKFNNPEESFEQ